MTRLSRSVNWHLSEGKTNFYLYDRKQWGNLELCTDQGQCRPLLSIGTGWERENYLPECLHLKKRPSDPWGNCFWW